MTVQASLNGVDAAIVIAGRAPLRLRIGAALHEIVEHAAEPGAFTLVVDGVTHRGWRLRVGNVVHLRLAGRTYAVTLADPTRSAAAAVAAGREVRAPLPGIVLDIRTEPGATVQRGDTLLVIESMKVQMTLTAPCDGTVEALHAVANAAFERDTLLVALQPAE